MLSFDPTDFIPKPLLWICTIPFMILLLPIGVLYCLIGMAQSLVHKIPFREYSHDIIFSIMRPGFYVGMLCAMFISAVLTTPKRRELKKEEEKGQSEVRNRNYVQIG
ncbi:hypothetical protein [Paenibacillus polymyxa]|uniref:Uncharacterized protein n=1 Tax=Paenibacillus polymyxa (strain SC2) TaxID=886882 RepID=E3EK30_PAEPS|nr:hypothetical protein [Paenibacillus polymyxa]ADO59739.1 hypothetical protein PPSC2_26480 [Paenibacillus polymyxa SC2]WPQ60025.1 hypothetical protein SKN87_27670 [Paenibacillus polymyxa]